MGSPIGCFAFKTKSINKLSTCLVSVRRMMCRSPIPSAPLAALLADGVFAVNSYHH